MKRLTPLWSFVLFTPFLLAQMPDSAAVKEKRYALITLTKYCSAADYLSKSQQPRMFAQISSGLGPSSGWVEFSDRTAWRRAGKPQPLALVWYMDDKVVRVAITTKDGGSDGQSYADYCYRADGSLARLRSVPRVQTDCDQSLFHCSVIFRAERLYPPKGSLAKPSAEPAGRRPSFVAQLDDLDLYGFLFRPLQAEKTTLSLAPLEWPEYLSVWDLPFNRLLNVSTK